MIKEKLLRVGYHNPRTNKWLKIVHVFEGEGVGEDIVYAQEADFSSGVLKPDTEKTHMLFYLAFKNQDNELNKEDWHFKMIEESSRIL